jgi:hypothetical protein
MITPYTSNFRTLPVNNSVLIIFAEKNDQPNVHNTRRGRGNSRGLNKALNKSKTSFAAKDTRLALVGCYIEVVTSTASTVLLRSSLYKF